MIQISRSRNICEKKISNLPTEVKWLLQLQLTETPLPHRKTIVNWGRLLNFQQRKTEFCFFYNRLLYGFKILGQITFWISKHQLQVNQIRNLQIV